MAQRIPGLLARKENCRAMFYTNEKDFVSRILWTLTTFLVDAFLLSATYLVPRACGQESVPLRAVSLKIDFDNDIRPIFARDCFDCHAAETQESHLRLDNVSGILKGGNSGEPLFVRGSNADSLLIKRVTSLDPKERMPLDGEQLSAAEIEILRVWIDRGAGIPGDDAAIALLNPKTDHWSFQPVKRPEPPKSGDVFVCNEIDDFVLAKLKEKGLTPSAPADRQQLIRRLYLAMHGLPPTPTEVTEFVKDPNPDAYSRLVDRVLASPRCGERWARHWMDVVRYADTNGFETNRERKTAYHYRDYLIESFNADKPYDQFIREQLAGDAFGVDAATGFLVAGAYDIVKAPDINLTLMQRQDELADMVNTTGTAFMGLTVGCARCHNHKFDPILQKDYYSMQAVFAGVNHGERLLRKNSTEAARSQELQQALAEVPGRIEELSGTSMGWVGTFSQPDRTHRLYRGDPLQPREVVVPDCLTVLGSLGLAVDESEQQRRVALANWIADAQHPLTARVMVNRLWYYLLGCGIVDTPSDFGVNGGRPTHPELLDWLADEFVKSGWSIKHIQRLILLSSTFQQGSAPRTGPLAVDSDNRYLWRFAPRRLEAEAIRDSILSVSGAMDWKMGGPGFYLMDVVEENVMHYFPKEKFAPAEFRRMVYLFRIRQATDSVFGSFDCPDGGQVIARRSRSNTPLQALNLYNSRFVLQQADIFAARLQDEVSKTEAGVTPEAQVGLAFALLFGRTPDTYERQMSVAMIREQGLPSFCRALFNTSEFLFVF